MSQNKNGNWCALNCQLTNSINDNRHLLEQRMRIKQSFDVVQRDILVGGREASIYFIDGFAKDEVMEKVLEFLMKAQEQEVTDIQDIITFTNRFVPYIEVTTEKEYDKIAPAVLAGTLALVVDGFSQAILIDARTYPARSVEEPEDDKVLRGSRDGFVETLIFNTALIRRRIRDENLTMEIHQVGTKSKTDVVLCYMDDSVDKKFLKALQKKIDSLDVRSLTMSQESLAEALVQFKWYNPFPKIRYTERPDAAAASILEGKIIVLVDNSPSAMIFPTAIFDFLQETDDFYFPPLTGTYLRLLRITIFLLTLFLTPVWYLLITNPEMIPPALSFIQIKEPVTLPVIFQLLILEFAVDGLKMASLNTPSVLSNSLSIIGGLILGEFAIKAQWFVPETILYMAFVAIANFTQPSYELGYAFKFMRVILLIATAIFGLWGFIGGTILVIVLVCLNKSLDGKSYLHPLIPFDGKEFLRLFIRTKMKVRHK